MGIVKDEGETERRCSDSHGGALLQGATEKNWKLLGRWEREVVGQLEKAINWNKNLDNAYSLSEVQSGRG